MQVMWQRVSHVAMCKSCGNAQVMWKLMQVNTGDLCAAFP